jgi:hypothetical protein
MRIFYAADTTPNPEFASGVWRANLHDSLVALGLAAAFRAMGLA